MDFDFVTETLAMYFNTETSNKVEKKNNCIIVKLANGENIKILVKGLS